MTSPSKALTAFITSASSNGSHRVSLTSGAYHIIPFRKNGSDGQLGMEHVSLEVEEVNVNGSRWPTSLRTAATLEDQASLIEVMS